MIFFLLLFSFEVSGMAKEPWNLGLTVLLTGKNWSNDFLDGGRPDIAFFRLVLSERN
jgi:hypothetical protein